MHSPHPGRTLNLARRTAWGERMPLRDQAKARSGPALSMLFNKPQHKANPLGRVHATKGSSCERDRGRHFPRNPQSTAISPGPLRDTCTGIAYTTRELSPTCADTRISSPCSSSQLGLSHCARTWSVDIRHRHRCLPGQADRARYRDPAQLNFLRVPGAFQPPVSTPGNFQCSDLPGTKDGNFACCLSKRSCVHRSAYPTQRRWAHPALSGPSLFHECSSTYGARVLDKFKHYKVALPQHPVQLLNLQRGVAGQERP